jgi:uncharacterized protein YjbI with pentapeptide repeats
MGRNRIERLIKKVDEAICRILQSGKLLFSNSIILRIVFVLGIILVLTVSIWLWWHLPDWQLPPSGPGLSLKDRLGLEDAMRSSIAQIIGGIVILIGLIFTWRQLGATRKTLEISQEQLGATRKTLDISQEGQITERFTRAIEQLGSDKLEIRLGGIYALERIARDSPRDHWPIMEVLTAFVREQTRIQDDGTATRIGDIRDLSKTYSPSTDIQAILTVIGRREPTYRNGEDQRLNLAEIDLRGAELRGVHLEGANMAKTYLDKADLREAHLEEAYLQDAFLAETLLEKAHLENASLARAYLQRAYLMEAHLEGANLSTANLQGAYLREAHLDRAEGANIHLEGASLQRASLNDAKLWEVRLNYARLEGASLRDADLNGAQMREANLNGASLVRTNLLGSDLTRAILVDARLEETDLEGAYLLNTHLEGVDLSHSKNLRSEQIHQANVGPDIFTKQMTKLPDYLPADLLQKRIEELLSENETD